MVITVFPTSKGIEAVHTVVPEATPASPLDVLQRTEAALDEAVPLTVKAAALVATMVAAGTLTVRDGGAPAGEGFDGGLDGGPGEEPEDGVPLPEGCEPPEGVPPAFPPAAPYRF